jgi:hypothetical protein
VPEVAEVADQEDSEASVLAVAWLFGTEPTDRALAGWSPNADTSCVFDSFLRYYGCDVLGHDVALRLGVPTLPQVGGVPQHQEERP